MLKRDLLQQARAKPLWAQRAAKDEPKPPADDGQGREALHVRTRIRAGFGVK